MKKIIIVIFVIILGLIIFFFPKTSGEGGTCLGCENIDCKCFGFEKNPDPYILGGWEVTCYGIPYDCETYIIK